MVILKKIFFKSIPVLFLFGCSHNHKSEIDILDHIDPMIGTGYHRFRHQYLPAWVD